MDTHGGYVMDDNGDYVYTDEVSVKDAGDAAEKKIGRRKLIRAFMNGAVSFIAGMHVGQRGPAFLDIQHISGTTVQGASSYTTALNFGYMGGSLISGFLYDRINNKAMMVCIPLTIGSILLALTPFCTSYISMLLMHIIYVPLYAVPETVITAHQMNLWENNNHKEAAMQLLSFCFSLGGVLGPLYTRPFLAPIPDNETDVDSNTEYNKNSLTATPYNVPLTSILPQNESTQHDTFTVENDTILSYDTEYESDLFYAYLITSIIGTVIAIPFYMICLKHCSKKTSDKKTNSPENEVQRKLALKPYIVLNFISAIFFFLYTMIEDTWNVFLSMFVVSYLNWTKSDGALLTSLYWGISTVSKLFMIILIKRLGMERVLFVSCLGMVVSLIGFIIASNFHIHVLIWITTVCFALAQASVFGGCFSWTDSNILKLDGKATSVAMISSALGAMTGPVILGATMESISFMVFPYCTLIECVWMTLHFMFMLYFVKPLVWRKYGDPCADDDDNESDVKIEVDEEKKKMIDSDKVVNGEKEGDLSTDIL